MEHDSLNNNDLHKGQYLLTTSSLHGYHDLGLPQHGPAPSIRLSALFNRKAKTWPRMCHWQQFLSAQDPCIVVTIQQPLSGISKGRGNQQERQAPSKFIDVSLPCLGHPPRSGM